MLCIPAAGFHILGLSTILIFYVIHYILDCYYETQEKDDYTGDSSFSILRNDSITSLDNFPGTPRNASSILDLVYDKCLTSLTPMSSSTRSSWTHDYCPPPPHMESDPYKNYWFTRRWKKLIAEAKEMKKKRDLRYITSSTPSTSPSASSASSTSSFSSLPGSIPPLVRTSSTPNSSSVQPCSFISVNGGSRKGTPKGSPFNGSTRGDSGLHSGCSTASSSPDLFTSSSQNQDSLSVLRNHSSPLESDMLPSSNSSFNLSPMNGRSSFGAKGEDEEPAGVELSSVVMSPINVIKKRLFALSKPHRRRRQHPDILTLRWRALIQEAKDMYQ